MTEPNADPQSEPSADPQSEPQPSGEAAGGDRPESLGSTGRTAADFTPDDPSADVYGDPAYDEGKSSSS